MTEAIIVNGLKKRFEQVEAIRDISFRVGQGELFGFLGPNGAGKTTTINMLTGLARPDQGTILISGLDCTAKPRAVQHKLGVVPDESNLYQELTGFQNLCFCASLYGIGKARREKRANELLEAFGLTQAAHRPFGKYSKGMKRKLTIAAGIIHDPEILFLDEPTTGIGRGQRPAGSASHRGSAPVRNHHLPYNPLYRGSGTAFAIALPFWSREKSFESIPWPTFSNPSRITTGWTSLFPRRPEIWGKKLEAAFSGVTFTFPKPGLIRVEANDPIGVGPLVRFLEDQGAEVWEARRTRPSLEDIFVQITGLEAKVMLKDKEKGGARTMNLWIAYWNILVKDIRTYYLKPPNVSWGIIFPLAWTAMFFIKSGAGVKSILTLLPGVVAVSILFGTTSMLAVTVTFEKKSRTFERLLLAPIPFELLVLAKTSGAILFWRGQCLCADPDGRIHHGFIRSRVVGVCRGRVPDRRGFDLFGTVHCRGRERSVRGSDVLQLFPISHGSFCVVFFFPIERLPLFLKPISLCPSPDLRRRCASWRHPRLPRSPFFPGSHHPRGLLRRIVWGKPVPY